MVGRPIPGSLNASYVIYSLQRAGRQDLDFVCQ